MPTLTYGRTANWERVRYCRFQQHFAFDENAQPRAWEAMGADNLQKLFLEAKESALGKPALQTYLCELIFTGKCSLCSP